MKEKSKSMKNPLSRESQQKNYSKKTEKMLRFFEPTNPKDNKNLMEFMYN